MFEKQGGESVDWIKVAQDKNRRRAFVNAVMNLLVSWLKKWFPRTDCASWNR